MAARLQATDLSPQISNEDIEQCRLMQEEEFQVLEVQSIQNTSPAKNLDGAIKLEIPVQLGEAKSIIIMETTQSSLPDRKPALQTISLSTLPPLLLHVTLPLSYPLHNRPGITLIRATHVWLSDIQALQAELNHMWREGEPVLFNWVEFIRAGEFLDKLHLISSVNSDIISLPHPAPRILAALLLEYDASSQSDEFAKNSYPCSVCLTYLKGSKCLQLKCRHIFCRSCLESFWKMCIQEGDVGRVGCPDPECVKGGNEASEEEVARVVTEAELQRWKWLREKRTYDRDPTVVHCPVSVCQAPVPKPIDVDKESNWSSLRECSQCGYSFCAFCRRTWHGPLSKCPIAQYEDLALEYLNAEEGSEGRAALERRYGKANIRRLVATYEEDKANLEWLKASTTMCPGCQCYVEKTLGCNHMTCWKCLQHFCYCCGMRLNPDQPYNHFSTPGQSCYNKLFDTTEVAEQDWELWD